MRNKTPTKNALFIKIATAVIILLASLTAFFLSEGCKTIYSAKFDPNNYQKPQFAKMTITGYCNCGKCCGWERTWYGKPVYNYGKLKGKKKEIGVTASGQRTKLGTLAADTSKYPYGTIIEIPGYGQGCVEDIGGDVKNNRIDAWFPTHKKALIWGKQELPVTIYLPKKGGKK